MTKWRGAQKARRLVRRHEKDDDALVAAFDKIIKDTSKTGTHQQGGRGRKRGVSKAREVPQSKQMAGAMADYIRSRTAPTMFETGLRRSHERLHEATKDHEAIAVRNRETDS